MVRGELHARAVHADVVAPRVRLGAELAHRLAVHRHAPVEHHLLGGAARSDAGLGEDLL